MKKDHWQRIETILDTVLTLPDQEWDAYLQKTCSDDQLIQEVKSILWGIGESKKNHFLERASDDNRELINELTELKHQSREDPYIGRLIGPYKISEKVGSGGMGIVYRAERVDGQFHQSVAIKLLKQGYHSSDVIHRFRVEQEILANLHHPNISQLYDAGLTEEGSPYLIMEFVDGVPIDEYANKHHLAINERLDLLIKVCNAVQYAHMNLVIHRDLKAQNILVNSDHQIKILDFGVAKLIDPTSTEITLIDTQPGQRLWTPHYASPEQIGVGAVSTASDVYSIGVLMHKLLTDQYPFNLSGKNLLDIENIIITQEPKSASDSIDKAENPEKVAEVRRITLWDLKKELKGDLDSIIAKALRKEPEARYESARQLADDLQRYQHNLPVLSRKGNLKYRSRKFIRRNAVPVISAVFMLFTIAALITYYTIRITSQRNKAISEAHKAKSVTDFMINIFNNADPYDQQKKNMTARQIIDQGAQRLQKTIDDPNIKATMSTALGWIYDDLGMYKKAKPLLYNSMKIHEKMSKGDNIDLASSYFDWANVNELADNYAVSKKYFGKSSRMFRRLHIDSLYAKSIQELGWVYYLLNDYTMADSLVQSALRINRTIYGDSSEQVARDYQYLAWIYTGNGNFPTAESFFHKALMLRQSIFKGDHPLVAQSLGGLARIFYNEQQFDSAEVYSKKALAMSERLFGKKHPQVATLLNGLGMIEQAKHKYKMSQKYILAAYKMRESIYGDNDPNTIVSLGELGTTYFYNKQYLKAVEVFKKTVEQNSIVLGSEDPEVATDLNNLGLSLWRAGKKQEAVADFKKAIKLALITYHPDHPRLIIFRRNLGDLYTAMRKYPLAEKKYLENFNLLKNSLGTNNQRSQRALKRLVEFYGKCGETNKKNYYSTLLISTTGKQGQAKSQ